MTQSADQIVLAARGFAATGRVFGNGCSEMVKTAYAAGGITIPAAYDANAIMQNYPCVADQQPGDIAGWTDDPHGHVVIYLGPDGFVNCPGENKATKIDQSMGHTLSFVRPS